MLAGGEGRAGRPPPNCPTHLFVPRLKPIQKMEGMTNGVAVGPQQATGLSDISAQVQQYQQFLGESPLAYGWGPGQSLWSQMVYLPSLTLSATAHGGPLLVRKVVTT